MEDSITITKPQLEAALAQWEHDARDGKTATHEESRALPVAQVAKESADWLWGNWRRSRPDASA